jgi:hypothetical protein
MSEGLEFCVTETVILRDMYVIFVCSLQFEFVGGHEVVKVVKTGRDGSRGRKESDESAHP